ncbi:GNAT family N-acetyltransferase [Sinorhizobium sp. NFACC03]|uniref:GNAT family N-acetyltransferase n=1 Tax=Sinorhizobium sp. NFACC03 TaxID=1566295 RepID=UPI000881BFC3|nr:GNAT family N-acetyltransferase [Sinorhizobium sp. NFACC03]SDA97935.1 phosphinothricin acetyltransferase [Sinorhizobium sp. NFACC03]
MLIRAAIQDDLPVICEIYNDAVANTTAIWNETLVDVANRTAWLKARVDAGYPVLVAVSDEGDVVGYASFGDWRAFDGYRHTVEHSVYVHKDRRGGGIGRELMVALIAEAERLGKHVMIAGIESENTASIRLHAQLGFIDTGRMREVGTKFGRWLDLTFMQLVLPTGSPR